jgi:hypothetical protein
MNEEQSKGVYYWVKHSKMFLFFELNRFSEKAKYIFLPDWVLSQEYRKLPVNLELSDKEKVFAIMNGAEEGGNPMSSEANQNWLRENQVGHTSMSVGDMIYDGEKWYVVLGIGFAEISWLKDRDLGGD